MDVAISSSVLIHIAFCSSVLTDVPVSYSVLMDVAFWPSILMGSCLFSFLMEVSVHFSILMDVAVPLSWMNVAVFFSVLVDVVLTYLLSWCAKRSVPLLCWILLYIPLHILVDAAHCSSVLMDVAVCSPVLMDGTAPVLHLSFPPIMVLHWNPLDTEFWIGLERVGLWLVAILERASLGLAEFKVGPAPFFFSSVWAKVKSWSRFLCSTLSLSIFICQNPQATVSIQLQKFWTKPWHKRQQRCDFISQLCDEVNTAHGVRRKLTWINYRFQWFFKLSMLHVVLDRQKKSKTILEKAFILYFAAFLSFCFFV